MPCFYTGTAEGDRALSAEMHAEDIQKELTKMTERLCKLCRHIEETYEDDIIGEVRGLKTWWREHKRVDAQHGEAGKDEG